MNQLQSIDPGTPGLRAHACIKHIPAWPDEDPRAEALRNHLAAGAPLPPVLLTARNEIVCADSLMRWRAARALQLETMPVLIVPEDLAATAALTALLHRRHLTKSALAYLSYPMMERALVEIKHRRLENLKKGQCFPESPLSALSGNKAVDLAEQIGVCRSVFLMAVQVHKEFASTVKYDIEIQGGRDDGATRERTLKEHFEPRILAEMYGDEHEQHRPMGLGAVLRGIGSLKSDNVRNQKRPEQLDLFTNAVARLSKCVAQLGSLSAARAGLKQWIESASDEDIERLAEVGELLSDAARARRKQPRAS